jgi:hypothetical protein
VIVRLRFAPSIIGTHYSSHSCVCCGSFGRVCWRSTGSVRGFRSWSRFGSSSCVRCARQRRRTVAHASLQPSRRRWVTAIHRDGVEPAQHNRFRAGAPQHFEQERRNGVRKRLEPFTVRTPFGPDLDYLLSLSAFAAPGTRYRHQRRRCSTARSPAKWSSTCNSGARQPPRLNTFTSCFPRIPLCSALRTLCNTTGHRLQRGLLRQHFFLGLRSANVLDFTGHFRRFHD